MSIVILINFISVYIKVPSLQHIFSKIEFNMSSIPFDQQYFVEKDRNKKYEWCLFAIAMSMFIAHGVLFHWIPKYLRRRNPQSISHTAYFRFVKYWDLWTGCFSVSVWLKTFFFQPSIVLLGALYLLVIGRFCYVETEDLNYQIQSYIIAKRILAVAMGNLPTILLMIAKNDLLGWISGLQHDRLTFVHKWVARIMWALITVHFVMSCRYWLNLNFPVMITIPPQIFGMIAYSCFTILTWGSVRFIRNWSFDFFLTKHRIANFIMLLMIFFHSPTSKIIVVLSVHAIVLDRVVSRVRSVIHKTKSPSKCLSEFEILDDETMAVTIPIRNIDLEYPYKWYRCLLPGCRQWRVGQHIYLNVGKISKFQYHPFTICSLTETGEMRLLIRKQKGFTKRLITTLFKMQEGVEDEVSVFQKFAAKLFKKHEDDEGPGFRQNIMTKLFSEESPSVAKKLVERILQLNEDKSADYLADSTKLKLKVTFHGPYGAHYQPFIKFDYALFIGAGSGAAFTLPVALDLLKTIQTREEAEDYLHRPKSAIVHVVYIIKKLANVIWFKDLIDEIMVFVSQDRAKLDIYVTQEAEPSIESFEKPSTQKGSVDVLTTTTTSISNSSYSAKYHYRPQVGDIIAECALSLTHRSGDYKSLAVAACGPGILTSTVKAECLRSRRVPHAPDIYCYTETF